jgi:DNA polymerase III delta prime subunit
LADLRDADLTLAKLDGADLRGAYLDGAIGLTVEHLQLALTDPATSGTLPQDELRVEGEVEAAGALSPRPRARGWRSVLWPLVVGLLAATGIYAVVTAGFSSALSRMQLRSLVVTSLIVAILAYVGAAVALTRLRNRRSRDRPAIERMPHGQGQRDRNAMLKRVRTAWIEGVLEQSLASTIWIELGLDRRPYAVRTPANTLISPFNGQGSVLPSGMPISEIFDELGQALMILGPPGSGKTTLLLTLARDLLDRAERDSSHPIPVVFNLSSWAAGSHSLADWLVEELAGTYDVPRRLGQAWIEREQVMPLLDGLDEVAAEHRKACVEAINAFREQHGLVPMVVCSRTAEFAALAVKLRLLGAVEIQPLTRSQVNAYLTQAGKSLAGVRAALRQDPTLWEFLSSPLELSVMALAYRGRSSAAVRAHGTPEQRRHELLDAYVTMMLARRGQGAEFPSDKTVRWLAWLAWSLQRRNQTEFRLEHIRPDWLPTRAQQRLLAVGSALLVGLLAGLSLGAAVGLLSGLLAGLLSGLLSGALFGLLAGLLGDRPDSRSTVSKQGIRGSVRNAAFVGIVVGLLSGLLIGLLTAPFRGLAAGLLLGLPAGLLLGGASTLQHVLLRILLTRSNYAPWRYARFLDYAADHLLLRKVGGGYIFAHRLLQEHFAMMDAGQAASASR